ncbi:MAG: hypothetical protein CMH83_18380 [Nocardioides sp.]|nr:hypothetical protein [Nocardioides sp.]
MRITRSPRRSRRTLAGLAAVAVATTPLLSSCGFNYATDRINTISAGINNRDGGVDVLGAVVIAGQDDLGVFAATLANNSTEFGTDRVLTGLGTDATELQPIGDVTPVDVPAANAVSLFAEGGIPVTGSFTAGDFVAITLVFDDGQRTSMDVPVVTPCREYSPEKLTAITLPTSADGATDTESTEFTEGESEETGVYSCELPTGGLYGHGEEH